MMEPEKTIQGLQLLSLFFSKWSNSYSCFFLILSKYYEIIKLSKVDRVGEGEGGTNWESSMEIQTLPRVKQIDRGKLLL